MAGTIAGDIVRARNAVIAAYLGWALDAFDFFILIFTFDDVAETFGVSVTSITFAITLTLATRAIGAFIFGRLADRYGRKPVLMTVVLLYSFFEAASGLAWSFTAFLIIRALFGIAMGGEWGVGSSLAMETIPARWRGWVSGVLQAGYPSGYFLATLLFGFAYHYLGWRGMFFAGAAPALLVVFINREVEESPAFRTLEEGPRVLGLAPAGQEFPAGDLRCPDDDGVQFLVARHAGHLSQAVPRQATAFHPRADHQYQPAV